MKKVIILALVAAAIWLGVNYARTGQISLFPKSASPSAQRLADLEAELAAVAAQIEQAGRSAGLAGMDTSGDVSALMARKEKIEKEIAALRAGGR